MPACEACRARMLDYLYDLLDAEEHGAFQAHLQGCASCQTSLAQASRQRGLLAAAARLEFPELTFRAPPAAARTPPRPAVPRPRVVARPRPTQRWGRAAAAAAILLALGGLLFSVERVSASHLDARREADAWTARVTEARQQLGRAVERAEEARRRRDARVAEWRAAATWHGIPPEAADQPHEYLTVLTTDRPVYRPGLDTIHYRALVLDRFTLRPAAEDFRLVFDLTGPNTNGRVRAQSGPILEGTTALRLAGPPGQVEALRGPDGRPVRGVGAGAFPLADTTPEGDYVLKVREVNNRFPAQQRTLHILRGDYPLVGAVEFESPTYKAGDWVRAYAHPSTPTQPVLAGRKVRVRVQAGGKWYGTDGLPFHNQPEEFTDAFGNLKVVFRLPDPLETDQALFVAEVEGAEPLCWPIPLLASQFTVNFHPEGGALVPGEVNRVFFESRTPSGAPAPLNGQLLADGEPMGVAVGTDSDTPGLGMFELTPRAGIAYAVRYQTPAGGEQTVSLPPATGKLALRIDKGVAGSGEPVRVHLLRGETKQPLVLALACRGRLLDAQLVAPGQTEAVLQPDRSVGGVFQVFAYEAEETSMPAAALALLAGPAVDLLPQETRHLVPLARRLVYRSPGDRLQIRVSPERGERETVLNLQTTDEKGTPVAALALVAVTYRGLAPADGPDPRAFPVLTELPRPDALDDPDLFLVPGSASDKALDRVLGARPVSTSAAPDPNRAGLARALERTRQETEEKRLASERAAATLGDATSLLARAHTAFEEALNDPAYQAAARRLASDQRFVEGLRAVALPIFSGLLVVALLGAIVNGLRRSRLFSWCLAGAACAGLWLAFLLTSSLPSPTVPVDQPQVALLTAPDQGVPPRWPEPARVSKPEEAANQANSRKETNGAEEDKGREGRQEKKDAVAGRGGFLGNASTQFRDTDRARGNADKRAGTLPLPDATVLEQRNQLPPPEARRFAGPPAAGAVAKMPAPPSPPAGVTNAGGAPGGGGNTYHADDHVPGLDGRGPASEQQAQKPVVPLVAPPGKGMAPRNEPAPLDVRSYTYQRSTQFAPALPAQTLYWHPALLLANGNGTVTFDPGEPGLTYQVIVYAHTADGRLGAGTMVLPPRPDAPAK